MGLRPLISKIAVNKTAKLVILLQESALAHLLQQSPNLQIVAVLLMILMRNIMANQHPKEAVKTDSVIAAERVRIQRH